MRIRKILLLYKISTFEYLQKFSKESTPETARFRQAHQRHYVALAQIEKYLKQTKIPFRKVCRGAKVNFSDFDVIVTVGGDGTFLEAAHYAQDQVILGVNSDPLLSVGRFCAANNKTFSKIFNKLIIDRVPIISLNRFCLKLGQRKLPVKALNDILVCHENPAAMSHYYLRVGKQREEQRSSGVWISTAAGSTSAIRSAGGQVLPLMSKNSQYLARELYQGWGKTYRLAKGVISPRESIEILSLMPEGVFFVDGAHQKFPFIFGKKLTITADCQPLRVVKP